MPRALEVRGLKKSFRAPDGTWSAAIDVPALDLAPGEHAALRESSGSGKTTLLNLLAGILVADEGSVRVAGLDLQAPSESERDRARARAIGYVFQSFHLLPAFSALENVALSMHFGPGADVGHASRLLARVGLSDRLHYRPRQLSIGQIQRVAVARALASRPALVLADEPTGNLDRERADAAMALMRDVCRENGAALFVVSHDERTLQGFERVLDLASINRAARGSR